MDATMEDPNEQTMFSNYVATPDGAVANSGTHVFRNSNTVNGGLGMNTFLGVNKGDTIKASAYAYYNDAGGSYNLAAGLIEGALFGSFGANYGVEGANVSQTNFDDAFASGTALGNRSSSSTEPQAYINYLVFDKEMNFVTASFTQITSASNGAMAQVTATDYIADREGYVMVYLSNETQGSELVVSWDDLNVYHGKTNVVFTSDYYPFGLTFNNYQRTASTPQNWRYNHKERQTDFNLNWDFFGARIHMPEIGRFTTLDPMADVFSSYSPYNYAQNNPIRYVDHNGFGPGDRVKNARRAVKADKRRYKQVIGKSRYTDNYVDCSEFCREIALQEGYDPGDWSGRQAQYYQETGEWVTDINSVRVGDFAFWSMTGEDGITHTGLVIGIDEDGKMTIAQSTRNGGGKSLNDHQKTNSQGTLWDGVVIGGTDITSTFVGAGRPDGESTSLEVKMGTLSSSISRQKKKLAKKKAKGQKTELLESRISMNESLLELYRVIDEKFNQKDESND